jgi:hypothetical protein
LESAKLGNQKSIKIIIELIENNKFEKEKDNLSLWKDNLVFLEYLDSLNKVDLKNESETILVENDNHVEEIIMEEKIIETKDEEILVKINDNSIIEISKNDDINQIMNFLIKINSKLDNIENILKNQENRIFNIENKLNKYF